MSSDPSVPRSASDSSPPMLDDASHHRNDQLLAFAEFAQALAVAANTRDVAEAVSVHLANSLGAAFANLGLVVAETGVLQVAHSDSLDADMADRYAFVPLGARTPLTDAVRTAEVVVVEDRATNAALYPDLLADTDAAGLVATVAVPLVDHGTVCGVIGAGWDGPVEFVPSLVERLRTVARLTAGTVVRTRATDLQAALITELQHHLLPAVPERAGFEIAVRYSAAGAGGGFGGDWYDVIELDADRTVTVVGDIVGHGIEAAARMAVVRTAINAVVRLDTPIEEVIPMAEPTINPGPDTMIGTAVLCVIDRDAETICYSSAGHPPMLVCHPNGTTTLLEDANGSVLGVARQPRRSSSALFAPGSILVAYTDGLVERRGEGIDEGIDRIRRALTTCHAQGDDVEATADAILDSAGQTSDLTDDIALVVLRRAPQQIPGGS